MSKARTSDRRFTALLTGVVLLTLTGLALLSIYFLSSRQSDAATGWVNPLDVVRTDLIAPDMAVLSLAGEPDDRVIRAALEAGETETAYAALAYSVTLPDSMRSGHWLLLGNRYREQDPARAAVCYQVAFDQVALSPTLGDVARAELALQAAGGFASLQRQQIAHLGLVEAENVARYSLALLPSQRRHILEQVVAGYIAIGDEQSADAVEATLDSMSTGPGVDGQQPQQHLPAMTGVLTYTDALAAASSARQQAAASMAGSWLGSDEATQVDLAGTLGETLVTEDGVRAAYYAEAEQLDAADRQAVLLDRIAWLTIKYRVARGAYGASLVPEWEQQGDQLQSELVAGYTELINGYGQLLDSLETAEALPVRVELLQRGLLWIRLGLFPDHAEESLGEQLREAARLYWTGRGGAGLVIVIQEVEGERFYLLSGSSPEKAG